MPEKDQIAIEPKTSHPLTREERWRRRIVRAAKTALVSVLLWILLAYVILPWAWKHYEHLPALEDSPKVTRTKDGMPGDPLNIALVGSKEDVITAMTLARWTPADAITWRSSLRIGTSVLLHRSYTTAPVSSLFMWGRQQDLAFELPVGGSARQRHHVRFWQAPVKLWLNGVPLWVGAVTFDNAVGLDHYTGEITHHIAPDVDADRDLLINDLVKAGVVARQFSVTGVGATIVGRNGCGDWYFTDGEMAVAVLRAATTASPGMATAAIPPVIERSPAVVQAKDIAFHGIRAVLGR